MTVEVADPPLHFVTLCSATETKLLWLVKTRSRTSILTGITNVYNKYRVSQCCERIVSRIKLFMED